MSHSTLQGFHYPVVIQSLCPESSRPPPPRCNVQASKTRRLLSTAKQGVKSGETCENWSVPKRVACFFSKETFQKVWSSTMSFLWPGKTLTHRVNKLQWGGLPNAYLTSKKQFTAATALISSHHDIKHRG
ncbi:hypothetical protein Q5P01_025148 [Channa striata]|uniref:Uncharacterized protein n=1 Tax=Channa striata TaxID=64152 RepID=A0AA88II52_CHASR|nr:hypothetical protein Q5P01_025148 [Channa striata]